jgi:hypothetical protein
MTPDVSVFSNAEVTAYVDAETITVCPTNDGCIRSRREGIEIMGLLGGQLVTDMTAFADAVPVASSSTETIAGRDARCVVPEDDELLQEYCYDLASGIALRWRVIDEGVPTAVTAIEVCSSRRRPIWLRPVRSRTGRPVTSRAWAAWTSRTARTPDARHAAREPGPPDSGGGHDHLGHGGQGSGEAVDRDPFVVAVEGGEQFG